MLKKLSKVLPLSLALSFTQAHAADISMESASAASLTGLMPQTMAAYWGEQGVNVQLALGQTLTKSLLKVGNNQLDAAIVPTPAYFALRAGKGPFAKIGAEKGAATADNVRSLFGFASSYYHAITWADSGIETFADAAGKRVYVGPPAGAASSQIMALAAAGGLEKGSYDAIKAPWGAAAQGFKDGQFDVYVGGFPLGSQAAAELSLQRKIRILGVKPENKEAPKNLGMEAAVIPAGTYPGLVNEKDVYTWKVLMFLGVQKNMSDETAYKLTKTYFDSLDDMAKNNALMANLSGATPFTGAAAPLHPGAVRYYKEQGIEIPASMLAN